MVGMDGDGGQYIGLEVKVKYFVFTGSPKTTARCKEEEAGNIGEAH